MFVNTQVNSNGPTIVKYYCKMTCFGLGLSPLISSGAGMNVAADGKRVYE